MKDLSWNDSIRTLIAEVFAETGNGAGDPLGPLPGFGTDDTERRGEWVLNPADFASPGPRVTAAQLAARSFRSAVCEAAEAEEAWWDGRDHGDPTTFSRQGMYWARTLRKSVVNGSTVFSIPWAAAFVSYCVAQVAESRGAEMPLDLSPNAFSLGLQALRARRAKAYRQYWAFDPRERVPVPGDIVVRSRDHDRVGFADLEREADCAKQKMLPAHADIVVGTRVHQNGADRLECIGGNLDGTVKRVAYKLDADGRLVRHIAVLSMV